MSSKMSLSSVDSVIRGETVLKKQSRKLIEDIPEHKRRKPVKSAKRAAKKMSTVSKNVSEAAKAYISPQIQNKIAETNMFLGMKDVAVEELLRKDVKVLRDEYQKLARRTLEFFAKMNEKNQAELDILCDVMSKYEEALKLKGDLVAKDVI